MVAFENVQKCIKYSKFFAEAVGFNVLKPDFKLSFISFIVVFDIITYWTFNFINIFQFWGNLTRVCFCLVTWTFAYQGIARIAIFYEEREKIYLLSELTQDLVKKMEKNPVTEGCANRYTGSAVIQTRLILTLFCICGILALAYPLYFIFVEEELLLPFGFVLPGIDYTTHPGFEINYFHHIIQAVFTCMGLATAQAINILFIITSCMQLEALCDRLSVLEMQLFEGEQSGKLQHFDLAEIVMAHQQVIV